MKVVTRIIIVVIVVKIQCMWNVNAKVIPVIIG